MPARWSEIAPLAGITVGVIALGAAGIAALAVALSPTSPAVAPAEPQAAVSTPQPDQPTAVVEEAPPTPLPEVAGVRLSASGSAAGKTDPFTTAGPWELHYTLNCSGTAVPEGAGGISITLLEGARFVAGLVDDLGDQIDRRVQRTEVGIYVLDVSAPCPWTVEVTSL
ncbi:hypothetical protein GT755_12570 [Herbidospora sp. NEAU-GS84]|uniref:Uncharacterized protein n=1 Tax=Herbidospora solisilvae TaxID=2696284 RepID=A0A7C9P021_9ACTN|nr:hypothetical protein [Herbidospora solisilvae]NAS22517.1 hypothetical protein [Herbidospora solisilvae]